MRMEQWGHVGSGDNLVATTLAHPKRPVLPHCVARSRRVERLLTSHGSEALPRTAAF